MRGNIRQEATVTVTALGDAKPINVGNAPWGLALSSDGTRLFVCNSGSNSISIIDTATHNIIETRSNINHPHGITLSTNDRYCYVTNRTTNTLSTIDLTTNTKPRITATGTEPVGIILSTNETRLYICNMSANTVSIVNTSSFSANSVSVGNNPRTGAASPDGKFIYICNLGSNFISIIDTSDNKVSLIPTTTGTRDIVFSPTDDLAYASAYDSIVVIDTTKQKVSRYIRNIGGASISINASGTLLHVADRDQNAVTAVNAQTGAIGLTTSVGASPRQLVSSFDDRRIYVCNYKGTTVSVIEV